jgi:branched-chain amino acid aminotransferase
MLLYLNHRLVDKEEAAVSVFDHGLLYGDGVYETMRAYGGVVFRLDEHLQRLRRSADLIGLMVPGDDAALRDALYQTLDANALTDAALRLTLTRGPGPLGLDPALCPEPTLIIIPVPFRPYPDAHYEEGVSLVIAGTRRNPPEALDPRIKSLNFLNNILAKREAVAAGAFDALMLNHHGHVTECTVSNLFFAAGDVLCTPSSSSGILQGITRQVVLDLARAEGITVEEGEFTADDLTGAEEVFLTNTSMEVMPVGRIGEQAFHVGPMAPRLRAAFKDVVRRETASR